jgi:uncharacterized protein DUF955
MSDALVPAFTRERIARLCADVLRESGALGVLPTPLDAVYEALGAHKQDRELQLGDRVLGAVWLEERAVFVDRRQSAPRRRFTEAHEAVHLLCPWHAAALRLDTAAELFGPLARGVEAEANFGAGYLIFQGDALLAEALGEPVSLRTPFALAARFGASQHAAAHHYVQCHAQPVALVVAGRWPGPDGALPIWRSIESTTFHRRFGRLAGRLRLHTRDGPLAAAIEEARRSSDPAEATLWLTDRHGSPQHLRAEVFNNRHCHLVFLAHAAHDGRNRRSRSALATTETLEKAIAAPAISGLSRPAAASGSAATL